MSQESRFIIHDSSSEGLKTQDPSPQPRVLSLESQSSIQHPVATTQHPAVSGVVLAGGTSKRMGCDKRFLDWRGTSLLELTLARLRPIVRDLIVVTREPEPLSLSGVRVMTDRYPGMGVLAGVHAGLCEARYPWAFVVAGDMPLLHRGLLQAMAGMVHAEVDVIVPSLRGMIEPLHALYRVDACALAAERALLAGRRRIAAFYPEVRVHAMLEKETRRWDPSDESFFNVNTLDDWAVVCKRL